MNEQPIRMDGLLSIYVDHIIRCLKSLFIWVDCKIKLYRKKTIAEAILTIHPSVASTSHRLRFGFCYSCLDKQAGELYAGFAYEQKFVGETKATCQREAAPSFSRKGLSYMLELGYASCRRAAA